MLDGKAKESNMVRMTGEIVSEPCLVREGRGEKLYMAYIQTRRISGVTDRIPLIIPGRLIGPGDCTGRMVSVEGQFRSYNRHGDGKSRLILSVFVKEFRLLETGWPVDCACNNQVFLDFLAQLRAHYLERDEIPTFQSVILAGVYDVRNLKRKIRQDEEHKTNSPWNIAADFRVDMSFSVSDIAGMLESYEADWHTGMDIREISQMIYDYTSGYPYLVSRLCMFMDEGVGMSPDKTQAWTKAGFMDALKILLEEKNLLYESLANKLEDYPELKTVLYELLFTGRPIPYTALNQAIEVAEMFGFLKNVEGKAVISNRIFETVLYNLFLSEEYVGSRMYDAGLLDKNQFVVNGHLNVRRVLERFVESFDALYGDADETFLEEAGRRYFMLFLKPIINGVGNCYVEARTRNRERMDLVIDYRGEQFVVELKIWRGNAYHERGEQQLSAYLDHFHLKKGYMLSFCFNKKKEVGVKEIVLGDRLLVEALV